MRWEEAIRQFGTRLVLFPEKLSSVAVGQETDGHERLSSSGQETLFLTLSVSSDFYLKYWCSARVHCKNRNFI